MRAKDITYSSLFAGVIAASTLVTVPVPVIPFTLQVFSISLTALCLPRKQAVLSVLIYITLGLIGLPVFAGGKGGFGIIASPTFGFILGFIPMVWVLNTLYSTLPPKLKPFSFVAANLTLYAVALPILYINLKYNLGKDISVAIIISSFWIPFLPTDIISMVLGFFTHIKLKPFITRKNIKESSTTISK